MRWLTIVATSLCLTQCVLAFALDPPDVSASSEEEPYIHRAKGRCPSGTFLSSGGTECRPCSACGPDLYVRHECTARKDTICDWCLNKSPLQNEDFENKCAEQVRTHAELQKVIGDPQLDEDPMESKSESLEDFEEPNENSSDESEEERRHYFVSIHAYESPVRSGCWEKVEPIIDVFFYLALLCLLVLAVRSIYKRRQLTERTFYVTSPVLDDVDEKNIIRAAQNIKCKLGKKGYERLEEFI
ncbi:hypothetical protein AAVH_00993 [Aphelenchoides avenae]|nr:hypothetical protein AAVH_00993 [Aphelenchus avenae]